MHTIKVLLCNLIALSVSMACFSQHNKPSFASKAAKQAKQLTSLAFAYGTRGVQWTSSTLLKLTCSNFCQKQNKLCLQIQERLDTYSGLFKARESLETTLKEITQANQALTKEVQEKSKLIQQKEQMIQHLKQELNQAAGVAPYVYEALEKESSSLLDERLKYLKNLSDLVDRLITDYEQAPHTKTKANEEFERQLGEFFILKTQYKDAIKNIETAKQQLLDVVAQRPSAVQQHHAEIMKEIDELTKAQFHAITGQFTRAKETLQRLEAEEPPAPL